MGNLHGFLKVDFMCSRQAWNQLCRQRWLGSHALPASVSQVLGYRRGLPNPALLNVFAADFYPSVMLGGWGWSVCFPLYYLVITIPSPSFDLPDIIWRCGWPTLLNSQSFGLYFPKCKNYWGVYSLGLPSAPISEGVVKFSSDALLGFFY